MARSNESRRSIRRNAMTKPATIAMLIVGAGAVCLLADCTGHSRPSADDRPNTYPDNYKSELLGFLHSYINDPTQIRDAAIADPVLKPVSNAGPDPGGDPMERGGGRGARGSNFFASNSPPRERYVVCVRYNAKDRDGRYLGVKQGMAIYAGGRFDRFTEQARATGDQAEYKPFPELQAL